MLYLGSTALGGQLKTKLFEASGTFVVPADVSMMWVDGCAGGSGGGGGNSTPGGGGGGGGAGIGVAQMPVAVVPGETLTVTVGANGAGGAPDSNGVAGGTSSLYRGAAAIIVMDNSLAGKAGANPNGGNGGQYGFDAEVAGGAGMGGAVRPNSLFVAANVPGVCAGQYYKGTSGAAGGALSFTGGACYGGSPSNSYGNAGAAGSALGGGGGSGGSCTYGTGGAGGATGGAGSAGSGYGAGGGGGSGNAAGGAGAPGMVRLCMITAHAI
jgi:hypothetical protein